MKITAIQQQVKRPERFSIFVDGKYCFSFGQSALLEQALRIGQELEESDIKELQRLSGDDKIYNAVLKYIAMRARSEWEITFYLSKKGADEALQQKILNKLSEYGYVDDEAFAKSWVENRRLLRPISLRKLQQELQLKRVPKSVIEVVLKGDGADDQSAIKALIAKKRSRYPEDIKLMQYLSRQGFSYDDIKSAMNSDTEE